MNIMRNEGLICDNTESDSIIKLISVKGMRRMQYKSSVVPMNDKNNFRSQYSQSIEISMLARAITQKIMTNEYFDKKTDSEKSSLCDMITCAGIIRGIGQPPFGYIGDAAIREWFSENINSMFLTPETGESILDKKMIDDLKTFCGAKRAVRQFCRYTEEIRLPEGILHILINSKCHNSEKCMMLSEEEFINNTEYPGTKSYLSYILEASAYIVSVTSAIEEAVENRYIICRQLLYYLRNQEDFDDDISAEEYQSFCEIVKYLSDCYIGSRLDPGKNEDIDAVHKWIVYLRERMTDFAVSSFCDNYRDISNGKFDGDLINNSWSRTIKKVFSRSQRNLFASSEEFLLAVNSASKIVYYLTDIFIKAVETENEISSLFFTDTRIKMLIPEIFRNKYRECSSGKSESYKAYLRIIMVLDYICSLTDAEALNLYRKLRFDM